MLDAKRTLVKSGPELWAEVSDPEALGRHFAAFGEIRITRTADASLVEWEGERAAGRLELEPSGFGTRVAIAAEPARVEIPAPPAPEPPEPPRRGWFAGRQPRRRRFRARRLEALAGATGAGAGRRTPDAVGRVRAAGAAIERRRGASSAPSPPCSTRSGAAHHRAVLAGLTAATARGA